MWPWKWPLHLTYRLPYCHRWHQCFTNASWLYFPPSTTKWAWPSVSKNFDFLHLSSMEIIILPLSARQNRDHKKSRNIAYNVRQRFGEKLTLTKKISVPLFLSQVLTRTTHKHKEGPPPPKKKKKKQNKTKIDGQKKAIDMLITCYLKHLPLCHWLLLSPRIDKGVDIYKKIRYHSSFKENYSKSSAKNGVSLRNLGKITRTFD